MSKVKCANRDCDHKIEHGVFFCDDCQECWSVFDNFQMGSESIPSGWCDRCSRLVEGVPDKCFECGDYLCVACLHEHPCVEYNLPEAAV